MMVCANPLRAGSRRRAAFVFGALLALWAAWPATANAQDMPAGYEEGIIAIAAQDLSVLTTIVLVDSAGQVLLPLVQVAEHLGFALGRPDSARIFVPRIDGGRTTLDIIARTISGEGVTIPLAPAEIVQRGAEVYLTAARIAVLVEGNATLDMATLSLVLDRIPPFPAQQQVQIDQRRAILIARDQHNRTTGGVHVPYIPATNGGMMDWGVSSSYLDPTKLMQFRAQLGAAVWGGGLSLGATATAGSQVSDSPHEFFGRYHRAFPDGEKLTQIGIGDIVTTGLFARFIRGVQATNAPQQRAYELGEILVQPDLPAGWQYEVLQNGQLLGFSDAVTQDPVAVPLRLGSTPVIVRMYGPGGQEVVNTLLYQTPTTLLERGRFEYAAAAGECVGDTCTRFGQLDARYGGWTKLTLGGGAEYLADSTGSALRPYALASFTTGTALTGELQIMPDAVYRASFMAFPRESSHARLSLGFSEPGYGRVSVLPEARGRWDGDASWDERLSTPIGPFRNLRASIGGTGFTDGTVAHRRVAVAGTLNGGYAELRWEKAPGTPAMLRAQTSLLLPALPAGLSFRPVLTAGLGVSRTGIAQISAGAIAQQQRFGSISLNADWARGAREPRITLSWQQTFDGLLAVTRVASGPRNTGGGSFALSGSIFAAPDGDLTFSGVPREGYGGIYGSVFLDNDMNGVFSPGDEPVPDARLVVGDARAVADQQGSYHAWSLLPYTALRISLDSTTIADPSWITAQSAIFARPVPHTAIRVDVPILRTREIAGRVVPGEGVATAGGITIQLAPVADGETTTITTFSDGQFYLSRVRPGRYTLRVAASSLTALRAVSEPEALQVDVLPGQDLLELPALVLRPARVPSEPPPHSARFSYTASFSDINGAIATAATDSVVRTLRATADLERVSGSDTPTARHWQDSTLYLTTTYSDGSAGPEFALYSGSHASGSPTMRTQSWMILVALAVLLGLTATAPSHAAAQATIGVSVTILPQVDAQPELVEVHMVDGRVRAVTRHRWSSHAGPGDTMLHSTILRSAAVSNDALTAPGTQRSDLNQMAGDTEVAGRADDRAMPITITQVVAANS